MASEVENSRISHARKTCRSIMDAITDAVLIFDSASYRILEANDKASELFGYSRQQLLTRELQALTTNIPSYADFLHPSPMEATYISNSGELIDSLVSLSTIDFWGRTAILAIVRDFRELKRVQASIAANEKKFRFLIQNISEIVALIDGTGIVGFISPQAERILGLSPDEVLGRNVFDLVHPEERSRAQEEFAETIRQPGQNVPSVLRFKDSTGAWLPFEVVANNQLDEPEVGGVIFTARDLRYRRELENEIRRTNAELDRRVEERTRDLARTNAALRLENQQRRYTEKQLKQSVSLLNATLESTTDGILVVSNSGAVLIHNQKLLEMWSIPASLLASANDQDLLRRVAPQLADPERFLESTRKVYKAQEETSFDTLRLKDGRLFERYSQPQKINTSIAGRVWSFRDITQAESLQEELRQAQKMEAVGRLAGGVAHEFNNVLMLISGYAAQLAGEAHINEEARSLCRQLIAATDRAASLTRQLLAFSRKHPAIPQVFDLNGMVYDMQKVLPRVLPPLIRLNVRTERGALPVNADRSQLELMLLNLVLNARDAMAEGGTLTITTNERVLEPEENEKPAGDREFVVLQVSDTGHGMTPEVSAHIFDPFYTTKDVGKGTGLGLSTVQGIVEQAAGHIIVESEPDEGTTFRVYFPKARSQSTSSDVTTPARAEQGSETVLLVEDEEGIRSMTRTYLEGLGYRVLEAASGSDAIQLSGDFTGKIHLLLTDIIMPEMRGDDLARTIQQQRPDMAVVFISGYANLHELDPTISLVEKPFTFPDLGQQIRQTLDASKLQNWAQRRVS